MCMAVTMQSATNPIIYAQKSTGILSLLLIVGGTAEPRRQIQHRDKRLVNEDEHLFRPDIDAAVGGVVIPIKMV